MAESVFALPVSVEQVAAVIKQMSQADQRHLLELVPNLRHLVSQSPGRTKEEAQEGVAHLREKVVTAVNTPLLSPDEPFLGNLTLRQYHALSEEEKMELWDAWAETDIMESKEREVEPDAVSAR